MSVVPVVPLVLVVHVVPVALGVPVVLVLPVVLVVPVVPVVLVVVLARWRTLYDDVKNSVVPWTPVFPNVPALGGTPQGPRFQVRDVILSRPNGD